MTINIQRHSEPKGEESEKRCNSVRMQVRPTEIRLFQSHYQIKIQKNKSQSIKQKEEIINLLNQSIKPTDIVKMGYPQTVVYRYGQKL